MTADGYFHLEMPRDFRYNSVAGDFRIDRVKDGFTVSWKTVIVGRDNSGAERFRIAGFGRRTSINADGTLLVTCNDEKLLGVFDAVTGQPIGEIKETEEHLFGLSWLPDSSGFVANTSQAVLLFAADGTLQRQLDAFNAADSYKYLGGVVAAPMPGKAYVLNSGAHKLQLIDLASGVCEQWYDYQNAGPDVAFLAHDRSRLSASDGSNVFLHGANALEGMIRIPIPGDAGVRQPGEESSSTCWAPLPKLSPDNMRILVNDRSGLLWLYYYNGQVVKSFPRDVLDYVDDTLWLDETTFVAITNDSRVFMCGIADDARPELIARDLVDEVPVFFALKSSHTGRYLAVDRASGALIANHAAADADACFDIQTLDKSRVALKGPHGAFVAVMPWENEVIVNGSGVGPYERLALVKLADGRVAFLAPSGQWLTVGEADRMWATSRVCGETEKFVIEVAPIARPIDLSTLRAPPPAAEPLSRSEVSQMLSATAGALTLSLESTFIPDRVGSSEGTTTLMLFGQLEAERKHPGSDYQRSELSEHLVMQRVRLERYRWLFNSVQMSPACVTLTVDRVFAPPKLVVPALAAGENATFWLSTLGVDTLLFEGSVEVSLWSTVARARHGSAAWEHTLEQGRAYACSVPLGDHKLELLEVVWASDQTPAEFHARFRLSRANA